MDVLTYVVASLANIAVVAFVVRRLLGVPVGWPRTIVLSYLVQVVTASLLPWTPRTLGLEAGANARDLPQTAAILTLVLAWVIGVQITILAILEAFVPTGSVPGPVSQLRSLPSRWRRGRRYTTIVRIAARHGLGPYLRPAWAGSDQPASRVAASLRQALTEGGVTFVKLGQMLSSRPDLVPPAFVFEVSKLQTDVAAGSGRSSASRCSSSGSSSAHGCWSWSSISTGSPPRPTEQRRSRPTC